VLPAAARFAELDALLTEALEHEPATRRAFVMDACGADTARRDELLRLIDLAERAGAWEDALGAAGAFGRDALEDSARALPKTIGSWRVVRPLGRGGMADVALAERQEKGFVQTAALKLMHVATGDPHALARFEQERQILATLSDARIARLYDGGVLADGRPWTAMEFVDGETIDRWCDAQRLTVDARVRLVIELIGAVASAHRSLVVHRDIKPANVLVTKGGQVKLLDFGIAKILHGGHHTTAMPWRVFTPQYAAPEQLLGGAITTATDTYQLGLLLFELLVGRRPFQDEEITLPRLLRAVAERESPTLSRALKTQGDDVTAIATARATSVERLRRRIRGDLSLIVEKALARDPARRYETAAQFGEDLQRFLDGRPVRAARPGAAYRARKFVARHRVGIAAASAVVVASIIGAIGIAWQAREALHQRDQAQAAAKKSETLLAFMIDAFAQADPTSTQGETVTARALLDRARARIDTEMPARDSVRADLLAAMSSAYAGLGLRRERTPIALEALAVERTLSRPRELIRRLGDAAAALRDDSRAAEAMPLLDEALALLKKDPNSTGGETGRLLFLKGMTHFSLRELPQSEATLEQALNTMRTAPDASRDEIRIASLMLSRRWVTGDRKAEGLALAERALAEARAAQPPRPADVVDALDTVGSAYNKLDRLPEHVAVYREAVALATQVYGPDHFNTGALHNNLAIALERVGAFPEALAEITQAVRVASLNVAPEHAFSQTARLANARLRCALGDFSPRGAELDAFAPFAARNDAFRERYELTLARCGVPAAK
jgi:eukaryotic-like serine/threonine-protein kinase